MRSTLVNSLLLVLRGLGEQEMAGACEYKGYQIYSHNVVFDIIDRIEAISSKDNSDLSLSIAFFSAAEAAFYGDFHALKYFFNDYPPNTHSDAQFNHLIKSASRYPKIRNYLIYLKTQKAVPLYSTSTNGMHPLQYRGFRLYSRYLTREIIGQADQFVLDQKEADPLSHFIIALQCLEEALFNHEFSQVQFFFEHYPLTCIPYAKRAELMLGLK